MGFDIEIEIGRGNEGGSTLFPVDNYNSFKEIQDEYGEDVYVIDISPYTTKLMTKTEEAIFTLFHQCHFTEEVTESNDIYEGLVALNKLDEREMLIALWQYHHNHLGDLESCVEHAKNGHSRIYSSEEEMMWDWFNRKQEPDKSVLLAARLYLDEEKILRDHYSGAERLSNGEWIVPE